MLRECGVLAWLAPMVKDLHTPGDNCCAEAGQLG
jgi:hypothetical protein